MSSSGNAPTTSCLSHVRHEPRKLHHLFGPLGGRQLLEVTTQSGALRLSVWTPVSSSFAFLHGDDKTFLMTEVRCLTYLRLPKKTSSSSTTSFPTRDPACFGSRGRVTSMTLIV